MCTSGETFPVWGNKYIAAIKYIISYDIFFFICNWANLFHLLRSSFFFFIIDECNISILLLKFIYIIVLIILKDFITFLFCSLINNLLFIYSSFNIIVQVEFYFTQTFPNENKQLMYKIMYKIIAQDGKKKRTICTKEVENNKEETRCTHSSPLLNVLTYELKRIKCKFLPGHGPDCPASLSPLQS